MNDSAPGATFAIWLGLDEGLVWSLPLELDDKAAGRARPVDP
jgi:hypothetical protein